MRKVKLKKGAKKLGKIAVKGVKGLGKLGLTGAKAAGKLGAKGVKKIGEAGLKKLPEVAKEDVKKASRQLKEDVKALRDDIRKKVKAFHQAAVERQKKRDKAKQTPSKKSASDILFEHCERTLGNQGTEFYRKASRYKLYKRNQFKNKKTKRFGMLARYMRKSLIQSAKYATKAQMKFKEFYVKAERYNEAISQDIGTSLKKTPRGILARYIRHGLDSVIEGLRGEIKDVYRQAKVFHRQDKAQARQDNVRVKQGLTYAAAKPLDPERAPLLRVKATQAQAVDLEAPSQQESSAAEQVLQSTDTQDLPDSDYSRDKQIAVVERMLENWKEAIGEVDQEAAGKLDELYTVETHKVGKGPEYKVIAFHDEDSLAKFQNFFNAYKLPVTLSEDGSLKKLPDSEANLEANIIFQTERNVNEPDFKPELRGAIIKKQDLDDPKEYMPDKFAHPSQHLKLST